MTPEYDHTSPAVPADAETARPACKTWCVAHDPDGDICASECIEVPHYGNASLTYTPVEGLHIHMDYAAFTVAETWQLTKTILALLDLDNIVTERPEPPRPEREIHPSIRNKAAEAGRSAEGSFLTEHVAYLKAVDMERELRGTAPRRPALWTSDDPCPAWCAYAEDHRDGDSPRDRHHSGNSYSIDLLTVEAVPTGESEQPFAPDRLWTELTAEYREKEPRLSLNAGSDSFHTYLSLDEAEEFATQILTQVRAARGQNSQPCLDVPCPDVACRICYPLPAPVGSST